MFTVSGTALDIDALSAKLNNHAAGALVAFEGRVRKSNEGRAVDRLEYELFEELCLEEGQRILDEARALFPIVDVQAVHRYGLLELGEAAVWVGVLSSHRGAAFQACRFIIDAIKARCPIWKKEYYTDGPTEWVGCATCEHHAVSPNKTFSRQARMVGVGGQKTLETSRVLIIGMGGLGCPAALNLAAAGVGSLKLVDGDKLEASNLHRQTLYSYHDVGSFKAVLAKRRLEEIHPFTKIEAVSTALTPENAATFIKNIDLVMDCTDNFAAKYLINDHCVREGIPYVQASIYQNQAQLFAYKPGESACFRCTRPVQPPANCVGSCSDSGVLGAATSIVGSWQALEGLRILLAQDSVAVHSTLHFDMESAENFAVKRTIDAECSACSGAPRTFDYTDRIVHMDGEISYTTAPRSTALWVDIRELSEGPSPHHALRLPLSSLDRQFFADRADQPIVIFCAKGQRSRALLKELRSKEGFEHVVALKGGVEAIPKDQPPMLAN
ncbi:MAG: ThiF family adenylyltransferase [Chitinophagaceae bacterium]|nr:ThiF family adenylyltransferase [Oligoflexus sp.]